MLNSNEELRLATCLGVLNYQLAHPSEEGLNIETQLWLANELERCQVELKRFKSEVPDREETRVVINQAKVYLTSKYKLTEDQAHKLIGKMAMSRRLTKKGVSVKILKNEFSYNEIATYL